jgi:hypothetical protein
MTAIPPAAMAIRPGVIFFFLIGLSIIGSKSLFLVFPDKKQITIRFS